MLYAFLITLCLVGIARADELPRNGNCPDVQVEPDFNINKFYGKWYYAAGDIPANRCLSTIHGPGKNGTIRNLITGYDFPSGENVSFTEGILRVPDISVPAKLKYRIKNVPSDFIVETDYLVLGTDYHSFAVVFTCAEYGTSFYTHGKLEKTTFSNYQRMWILTRQQKPAAAVIEKANAVLNDKKIIKSTSFHTSPVC